MASVTPPFDGVPTPLTEPIRMFDPINGADPPAYVRVPESVPPPVAKSMISALTDPAKAIARNTLKTLFVFTPHLIRIGNLICPLGRMTYCNQLSIARLSRVRFGCQIRANLFNSLPQRHRRNPVKPRLFATTWEPWNVKKSDTS